MPLSKAERKAIASLGGLALVAQGKVNTAVARQSFRDSFLDKVDPDHVLPLAERARRAEAELQMWYRRNMLKALTAKRKKREASQRAAKATP